MLSLITKPQAERIVAKECLRHKYVGIRLFTLRTEDGEAQADCRINGEDFESVAIALHEYAKTWPFAGYELRKQYIVMHTERFSPANG